MPKSQWRLPAAGAIVVVGAATGVVTNLITTRWSIGLGAGLGVLLVIGVILQVALATGDSPPEAVEGDARRFRSWCGRKRGRAATPASSRQEGMSTCRREVGLRLRLTGRSRLGDRHRPLGARAEGVRPGQGTVIQAGGNVITGDVFVGRFARLRDKWLDPAPVFEDVQVKQFIGRAWLLEQLDAFLVTHDRGHVVVQADAGLGKTALAAWLAHSRNWPCHFTRGRNGQVGLTALGNLAAQLIARYELGDQFAPQGMLPDTAGEPGWFEQVLQACADAARATGGHVVIVVDGLDEAEVVKGALPLGLPVLLPRGAFIVATWPDRNGDARAAAAVQGARDQAENRQKHRRPGAVPAHCPHRGRCADSAPCRRPG